jgi:hypothetical protein
MYTTCEQAKEAVELTIKETIAGNPELATEGDSIAWDMTQAVMSECTPAVARELGRCTGVSVPRTS